MSTTNQITAGGFQDILGNPIANGTLTLELSQDCIVNSTIQICSIDIIRIPLDDDGNVTESPDQYVWPNDQLMPANTYYAATVYSADGALVWGPNNLQILSTPSPFNLTTDWIPGNPV